MTDKNPLKGLNIQDALSLLSTSLVASFADEEGKAKMGFVLILTEAVGDKEVGMTGCASNITDMEFLHEILSAHLQRIEEADGRGETIQ